MLCGNSNEVRMGNPDSDKRNVQNFKDHLQSRVINVALHLHFPIRKIIKD